MGRVINFTDPSSGISYAVNADDPVAVRAAQARQWIPETPEDAANRTIDARTAEDYNTVGDKIAGAIVAPIRGATAGLIDPALTGLGIADGRTLRGTWVQSPPGKRGPGRRCGRRVRPHDGGYDDGYTNDR